VTFKTRSEHFSGDHCCIAERSTPDGNSYGIGTSNAIEPLAVVTDVRAGKVGLEITTQNAPVEANLLLTASIAGEIRKLQNDPGKYVCEQPQKGGAK
jgi:hypothetical protein